ncbi:MAG: hypothetical protein INR69_00225 [Mucilaginibacter polytrichastri]|nr:hypothetical protein [Mucilaginibacter polytrichastri]
MDKLSFLKMIIDDLAGFAEDAPPDARPVDFYRWMLRGREEGDPEEARHMFRRHAGRLVVNMYRYSRHHIRKKLQEHPALNFEEFVFLSNLAEQGCITKSELIQVCVQEKTTGMAVIGRLIAMNLVDIYDDPDDRRKTLIDINQAGRDLLRMYFDEMEEVLPVLAGNLSASEKIQLIQLLSKLNAFHYRIFSEDHDAGALEISKKYL